ncbi:sulfite exporter TauE/SafE family protein [Methylophilaceae bacterium]|jgi:hypothetical protein|nr:sulfite exporter TauE/SafE family protein [Methylophilaceae bacterium]|tara:strand:- start:87 stop:833 length:747 start_codon:yes stop_codon:yes gene_type:complete
MTFLLSEYITAGLIFIGAILYSSVGHGGASSYIAIMSLMGTPVASIKPIGLILNIIVSSVASYRFIRNKLFNLKVFIPVVLGSVPSAFLGGYLQLPSEIYKVLVGIILIFAGVQFLFDIFKYFKKNSNQPVNFLFGLFAGVIIGFLSGLTGTGGGIFLSPLIVFLGWTSVKGSSGTVAAFILFNSISGLLGNITSVNLISNTIFLYAFAVIGGVLIGTQLGIKIFNERHMKNILGVVLIVAGFKFIIT